LPLSKLVAAVVLPFVGVVCIMLGIIYTVTLVMEAVMPTCTSYVNQYNGVTMLRCSGLSTDLGLLTATLFVLGLMSIRIGRRCLPSSSKTSEPDAQKQATVIHTIEEPEAKSEPTKATMYCSQCGAVIQRDSKFCKECGTKQV
jgi:hypothetical protein